MKKLFTLIFVLLSLSVAKENLRVFGTNPQITVLLEILYPKGLIGLNYKPYKEDLPFMPESIQNLPILGGIMGGNNEMSFEIILSLKPDFIIFSTTTPKEIMHKYEKFGIKTLAIDTTNPKNLQDSILLLGKTLKIEQKAKELNGFINNQQKLLKDLSVKITHRPRIYFAQGINGLQSECGNDKEDLAQKIGGENILECTLPNKARIQTNFETLLSKNPDIIFVREIELFKELIQNPSKNWQNLKAIQNKNIFYAPSSPSNWLMRPPSIMQNLGILWAFSKTQPHLLNEEKIKIFTKNFYKKFLRALSDEDYQKLMQIPN